MVDAEVLDELSCFSYLLKKPSKAQLDALTTAAKRHEKEGGKSFLKKTAVKMGVAA